MKRREFLINLSLGLNSLVSGGFYMRHFKKKDIELVTVLSDDEDRKLSSFNKKNRHYHALMQVREGLIRDKQIIRISKKKFEGKVVFRTTFSSYEASETWLRLGQSYEKALKKNGLFVHRFVQS